MKKTTKQSIVKAAIKCFNENNFSDVTLQEIAQHLKWSRREIVYHFNDKEAILRAITKMLWQDIQRERALRKNLASFQNIHLDIKGFYHLQQHYSFLFLDANLLNHLAVRSTIRDWADLSIQDNEAAIAFAIQLGNMQAEPFPGVYRHLANSIWMVFFYWLSHQKIRANGFEEDAERAIWSLVVPFFTPKGMLAFNKYFGENYLESLGHPFDLELRDIVLF